MASATRPWEGVGEGGGAVVPAVHTPRTGFKSGPMTKSSCGREERLFGGSKSGRSAAALILSGGGGLLKLEAAVWAEAPGGRDWLAAA